MVGYCYQCCNSPGISYCGECKRWHCEICAESHQCKPLSQIQLADNAAQWMLAGLEKIQVTVPDKVIRDAFLKLYRERHPGVPLPRVLIKAKE